MRARVCETVRYKGTNKYDELVLYFSPSGRPRQPKADQGNETDHDDYHTPHDDNQEHQREDMPCVVAAAAARERTPGCCEQETHAQQPALRSNPPKRP